MSECDWTGSREASASKKQQSQYEMDPSLTYHLKSDLLQPSFPFTVELSSDY